MSALAMSLLLASELAGFGGARFELPLHSLKEARYAATTRQQFDFSCGSAAVATLLSHHYGRPTSERAVFDFMYAHGEQARIQREGFSLLDMQSYLRAQGFQADGFHSSLERLRSAGLPAIALIEDGAYRHFVVIKGIDAERVLIGDPARGVRAMARTRFEQVWQQGLLFLIHDAPAAPRFNVQAEWQAVPTAPLAQALPRPGLDVLSLPKNESGNF